MTKKVTELPAATTPLAGADILLVVQGGVSKQSPVSSLPAIGGSLTNWTEAVSTAAPNATVPVTSFTATNAATNVDAALRPKGNGAVIADVPDNTVTGGNKRGQYAVDFQRLRLTATHVASGVHSGVLSGRYNTASQTYSLVCGGNNNVSSANSDTVCGGDGNTSSGAYCFVGGGNLNSAIAIYSSIGGGNNNTASGDGSSIAGGIYGITRGIYCAQAHASGRFSAQGDAQREDFVLRRQTSDATPTALSADGAAASATNQVVLPNNGTYDFFVRVVARAGNTDQASYRVTGLITRGANAAATSIIGTPTVTTVAASGGAGAWVVAVSANTTLGCLTVTVTGAAATNIKWVAHVETVEVVG